MFCRLAGLAGPQGPQAWLAACGLDSETCRSAAREKLPEDSDAWSTRSGGGSNVQSTFRQNGFLVRALLRPLASGAEA